MILKYLRNKILEKRTKPLQIRKGGHNKNNKFINFNFQYRNYGKKNPDKIFFVIRRIRGAGFFSNLNFVIHNLYISEKLGTIPVIDMENYPNIYNCKINITGTKNSWEYYFEPVSKYKLNEVYKSKNVILCDNNTSKNNLFNKINYKNEFKYFNGFSYLTNDHYKILKKYIIIKKNILKIANSFYKKNLYQKKVLGVCFRGSDQKKSGYHHYPPTEKQMLNSTEALMKKFKFEKIYLCTEDINYLNLYKKKYSKQLVYFNNPRTDDKKDLFESNIKDHRYKIGLGNLIDMIILSKTNYLLHGISNIPSAAIFYSNKKKIPVSVINNGMSGNIFFSQFSFYVKKILPETFGGFKKNYIK
jgi:hypothetical protein